MEELVTVLYQSGQDPEQVKTAQASLRRAQTSEEGWALAKSLLVAADANSQFLGAQTFLVQLNNSSSGFLPSEEQQRNDVKEAIQMAVAKACPAFVIRKLLAAAAKMFLHSNYWPDCPLDVLAVIGPHHNLCFDFLAILVEDADLPPAALRQKLVPAVSQLCKELLATSGFCSEHALNAFESWASSFFAEFSDMLPALITALDAALKNPNEELTPMVLSTVLNLFVNSPKSWPQHIRKMLYDVLMAACVQHGVNIDEQLRDQNDVFQGLARLVIGFCESSFTEYTELHPFISRIAATTVLVPDDPLATEVLEFWNEYTEEIISSGLTISEEVTQTIVGAISSYWPRVKLYPELKQVDWDEMASFRKDFADFLELAYPLLGTQLFDHLTNVVLDALQRLPEPDWMSIESGLFCLNGLADIIGDNYQDQRPEFQSVKRIFQSSLWERLPLCSVTRVRQTAVNVIGCFVDFFLSPEGLPYLSVTLNFLFRSLSTPSLQTTASRSILKLCDTCHEQLVPETFAFLRVYEKLRSHLAAVPHVRTVSAISCVIQAIEDHEMKVKAAEKLFQLVVMTEQPQQQQPTQQQEQLKAEIESELQEFEQMKLKCVAAFGKIIQLPATSVPTMRTHIKSIIEQASAAAIAADNLMTLEAVCEIVKAGATADGGILALEDSFTTYFVVSNIALGTRNLLPVVFDLGRVYVTSKLATFHRGTAMGSTPYMSQEALRPLLESIMTRGQDSLSASIDFLTQIVQLASDLGATDLSQVAPNGLLALELPIMGLGSSDRFILRSAGALWKTHLALMQISYEIAEKLVCALLVQASGRASRSDIGPISEVFKVLMTKQPLIAGPLLKRFALDEPVDQVMASKDSKARRDFVAQLVLVKGGRKTQEIVQNFWQICRGIPAAYNPHSHA